MPANATFSVELEGWLRDFRKPIWVIKQTVLRKFNTIGSEMVAFTKSNTPVGPSKSLRRSIRYDILQSYENSPVYSLYIHSGSPYPPYAEAIESGRAAKYPPFDRILLWVSVQFPGSVHEVESRARGVWHKLGKIGFDGNIAPYRMFEKTRAKYNYRLINLCEEVGIYVVNALNGGGGDIPSNNIDIPTGKIVASGI